MNNTDQVIIECWNNMLIERSKKGPIELPAGSTLYHGARRSEGELASRNGNWLWADHWYSQDRKYAECYSRSWCDGSVDHAMLEVEPLRDLTLLDMTGTKFNDLCQQAIDTYGIQRVGHADWPIRRHFKATARNLFGNMYDGYAEYDSENPTCLKEIFIFDYYHNLIYSTPPEIIKNSI